LHEYTEKKRKKKTLQGPQANVGDGEDAVVAHVVAAWLSRVADEVLALITPHPLGRHHEHHHPEDKDHGQPDPSKDSGVFVDTTEEGTGDSKGSVNKSSGKGCLMELLIFA
uniref:Uncharacterized protein n=1 Tax=Cynoglossus semilaevis TaxID=244447 RepID=A0A3P8WAF6_CYNSE